MQGEPREEADFAAADRAVLLSETCPEEEEAAEEEAEEEDDVWSMVADLGHLEQFERVVPVNEVLYTQQRISRSFSDGRKFDDLIAGLDSWEIDPGTVAFLQLDAFEYEDARGQLCIHSLENRRLFCLKQHQQNVQPWTVNIRLQCIRIPNDAAGEVLKRFIRRSGRREICLGR